MYNRCTGIYKFGNNTYPRCIRCRSNLGHFFGEKSVSYGLGNMVLYATGLKTALWGQNALPHWRYNMHWLWRWHCVSLNTESHFIQWISRNYSILVLGENYRLLFPATAPMHVWAVSWAGYNNVINKLTGSGNKQLSDKKMMGDWRVN